MSQTSANKFRAFISEVDSDIKSTLSSGLDFIDWQNLIPKNARVFIKPNFTFPEYRKGITTSPELISALLEIIGTRTSNITIGESDGGNNSFKADDSFKGHGLYRIGEETGARIVNLSTLPREDIESEVLGKKVRVSLPRLLLEETDCFISVPVLKVHVMTQITLSLKNSWGCVPDTMRCLQHQNLAYKLALINQLIKPRIVVIDGIYALNGHGPMFGEAVNTNLLITADNPVVADSIGTRIMGFSPAQIKHIVCAEKLGLGRTDLAGAEISGDWREFEQQFYVRKSIVDRVSTLFFYSDALARLVMRSPLTPLIYGIAGFFKTADEKEIASDLEKNRTLGLY